jgi:hypothetical protein
MGQLMLLLVVVSSIEAITLNFDDLDAPFNADAPFGDPVVEVLSRRPRQIALATKFNTTENVIPGTVLGQLAAIYVGPTGGGGNFT